MKRLDSRLVLCASLLAAFLAVGSIQAQPMTVGEYEPIALTSGSDYPIGAREWTVSWPDATYIRVHFSQFDLAPGDFVSISNLDGTYTRLFDGKGPHGNGNFWAATIPGDTAVIRLQAEIGGGAGFTIDGFGRGTVDIFDLEGPGGVSLPDDPSTPESVCGTNDWEDVKCYESSHPDQYAKARAAVKLQIGCCSACTGFKVSDSGQFLTNNHCTSTSGGVASTELLIEYQNNSCGGGGSGTASSVFGDTLVKTASGLDYTLMTTTGDSSSIPCLELDPVQASVGDRMYIAHHPSAGVKKMSIFSDQNPEGNPSGVCRVNQNDHFGNFAGSDIGYLCDTTNGSSGSPVLNYDTHKVIALHHFGGCLNSGGRSDLILAPNELGGLIGTCTDGGGNPDCGNGVIDPGEVCDGADLGGETCQSQGFDGGTLACNAGCSGFDTSGCFSACGGKSDPCDSNADCCSNKCKGKRGSRTCR